jgi:hypothetical protein
MIGLGVENALPLPSEHFTTDQRAGYRHGLGVLIRGEDGRVADQASGHPPSLRVVLNYWQEWLALHERAIEVNFADYGRRDWDDHYWRVANTRIKRLKVALVKAVMDPDSGDYVPPSTQLKPELF